MRCYLASSVILAVAAAETPAFAQQRDPNTPEKQRPGANPSGDDFQEPEWEGDPSKPLPAQVGFQLATRVGLALPFGDVASGNGNSLSDAASPQVAFVVDIGGKPIPQLFVGIYGGGAIGVGESKTIRFGIEAMWFFLPDARWNPWIGYGLGYEQATMRERSAITDASGIELAHLMAGLDLRFRSVGVGPFFDLAIGRYDAYETKSPASFDRATHYWATFGARVVVNP